MAHVGACWLSVTQCRKAFSRFSSIQSGSFFLAEIRRTTSSLRPLGATSDSMSMVNPHLYSASRSLEVVAPRVITWGAAVEAL